MDRIEIRKILEEKLPPYRFEHTLGVEYTATALAMCYGVNLEQAALAGLLHDCAKHLNNTKKIDKCKRYGLPISKYEALMPELLHAKLGAFLAKEKYGVTDKAILSAISCHTTGKPDMSTLDKILYIADYIEPNRSKAQSLNYMRMLAFKDLDTCFMTILEDTIAYLQAAGSVIDDTTLNTYEFYSTKNRTTK